MPKDTKETSLKQAKDKAKKVVEKSDTISKKVQTKSTSTAKTKTVKSKKAVSTKAVKKDVVSKKIPSKKTVTKTSITSKKSKAVKTSSTSKKTKKIDVVEYYDLPYRYNQTIVKILAQTPKTLFVYWDVSDKDRKSYAKKYGENFFNETVPVLIIRNITKKYTFEIEINDFANCWYFNVQDEKCEYLVELGRRPRNSKINIPNNYLYVASSNEIESPNGHILFEKEQKTLYFRNVKNNTEYSKDIANLQFINYFKRVYKIYDLYKFIYKNEEILDIDNPTSTFK